MNQQGAARLLVGAVVGAVAAGGLVTSASAPASAVPGQNIVDSAKFATPGGHGNFRWRYSSSQKRLCGIYPTGRSYTVRCAARIPSSDGSGRSDYNAIEIGRAGVRRTATDGETYSGAKRLWPGQTISVVGITCTAFKRATITCETRKGAFRIVGGVAKLPVRGSAQG
ncbi:MAG TPA: hypothetical protein PK331_16400 [Gordonia sp. (in: high G+C Gram-positive bacteria)]|uniref:hypothetical protein n=1 Tax=unclassified Gordonia (in: high G+C Gram-positive bacteria) TaxID=2657482 RepID=UPI000FBC6BAB|nr:MULTISPECIES: hypothetical protein [unclassified Gordonia (in: high G+C Gram-positive bacteria)]RUP41693.1 MAG: hypothetical protein EKK60_00105 [Gordonia sp. (in: high G+C Gram-positive bacteria)]HNP57309.1 hypothetical protein [Gordonia sp. (in: high G+C Gram-positive bacteria)]HRC52493.1 hypothetical protein [Gordonia sp. (in: high G+C Gram-positive bacteria)]